MVSSIFLPFQETESDSETGSFMRLSSPGVRTGRTTATKAIAVPKFEKSPLRMKDFNQSNQKPSPMCERNSRGENFKTLTEAPISYQPTAQNQPSSALFEDDFNSDSGETFEARPPAPLSSLQFLSFEVAAPLLVQLPRENFTEFGRFLDSNTHMFRRKVFRCEHCPKSFNTAQSKGGHISKNHPQASGKFRNRQYSSLLKKTERSRLSFFRNLPSRHRESARR